VVKERDSDRNKKKELGPAECKLADLELDKADWQAGSA
jgi:hypothetical protein